MVTVLWVAGQSPVCTGWVDGVNMMTDGNGSNYAPYSGYIDLTWKKVLNACDLPTQKTSILNTSTYFVVM